MTWLPNVTVCNSTHCHVELGVDSIINTMGLGMSIRTWKITADPICIAIPVT